MTDITATEVAPEATEAPAPVARAPRGDRPIQTVGRRKEAIVRVRIVPGSGKITCNGRDLEAYFPSKVHQQLIREPLITAEKAEAFDVIANLRGGGITGQAGALRLGIARALIANDADDLKQRPGRSAEVHLAADRAAVGPVAPRHRFVNDCRDGTAERIGVIRKTSVEQRDAQRVEVRR